MSASCTAKITEVLTPDDDGDIDCNYHQSVSLLLHHVTITTYHPSQAFVLRSAARLCSGEDDHGG